MCKFVFPAMKQVAIVKVQFVTILMTCKIVQRYLYSKMTLVHYAAIVAELNQSKQRANTTSHDCYHCSKRLFACTNILVVKRHYH